MAVVFLIRHCEPVLKGVVLGQIDSPLSGAGQQQACELAAIEVAVVWSSPLARARETAEHLKAAKREVIPDLREIDHGEWSGKTWAEIEAGWPEIARRKLENWNGVTAPGGEAWPDFLARVEAAWETIRSGDQPAAVVAHQGVNSALLNIINGADPLQFTQGYGEAIRVEYD